MKRQHGTETAYVYVDVDGPHGTITVEDIAMDISFTIYHGDRVTPGNVMVDGMEVGNPDEIRTGIADSLRETMNVDASTSVIGEYYDAAVKLARDQLASHEVDLENAEDW